MMRMKQPLLTALSLQLLHSTKPSLHRPSLLVDALQHPQQPLWMPAASLQTSSAITFSGNMTRGPVIAFSHGGGPMPLLGDPNHADIVESLRFKVPKLLRLGTPQAPRAIVLVTAHWSERNPSISSGEKHRLEFDYYGFPEESYKLKYNAPGSPDVANEVAEAMKNVGLKPDLDDFRGWDHGVFVPMLLINPDANIPIVQVSVLDSESPEEHFKMGKALNTLRESNIAILGSGFASLHNLRIMLGGSMHNPDFRKRNEAWSEAVWDGVKESDVDKRLDKVRGWREWPAAYEMHPRGGAEHFMPLLVCAGAGGPGEAKSYKDEFMGIDIFSYYWDE